MTIKNKFSELSAEERLKKLAQMSDDEIDYSDIPSITDFAGWVRLSEINKEFAAVIEQPESEKITVNLRLDKEIVDFFKENSKRYQSKINEALLLLVRQYKKSHLH
ncbi:MAG: BrnA antitoxin family protein [Burkholderiales bacterium]|nr:BrnA antitoxin family protein [Burkholderiales bacterium]